MDAWGDCWELTWLIDGNVFQHKTIHKAIIAHDTINLSYFNCAYSLLNLNLCTMHQFMYIFIMKWGWSVDPPLWFSVKHFFFHVWICRLFTKRKNTFDGSHYAAHVCSLHYENTGNLLNELEWEWIMHEVVKRIWRQWGTVNKV